MLVLVAPRTNPSVDATSVQSLTSELGSSFPLYLGKPVYLRIVWRCMVNQTNLVLPTKVLNKPQARFIEHYFCGYSPKEQRVSVPFGGEL